MASNSGSRASSSKKSTSSSSGKRSTTKGKSGGRNGKSTAAAKKKAQDSAIANEIVLIGVFALSILLFLCNFGIIGPVGNTVSGVMFGIFGLTAYVVPVLVFLSVAFGISNSGNTFAIMKLIAAVIAFLLAGIVLELVGGIAPQMEQYSIQTLYETSLKSKAGGGAVAGSLAYLLCHFLGMVGAVLLVIVLGIICLVIITEKSFVSGVKKGGRKVYESAREDAIVRKEKARRRREEMEERRQEEEKQREEEQARKDAEKILRMDKKAAGLVNLTLDKDTAGAKKSSGQEKAAARARDDIHEITLEGVTEERTAAVKVAPVEDNLIDFDKIRINSADPYREEPERAGDQEEFRGEAESFSVHAQPFQEEPEPFRNETDEPEAERLRQETQQFRQNIASEIHRRQDKDIEEAGEEETVVPSAAYAGDVFHDMQEMTGFDVPFQEDGQEAAAAGPISAGPDRDRPSGASAAGRTAPSQGAGGERTKTAQAAPSQEPLPAVSPLPIQRKPVPPRPYQFPPLALLNKPANKNNGEGMRELKETAMKLQQTLATFGVKVTITDISKGPSVTRYELQPEQGVKVSKILGLSDDIKLNLAATDIRIEAPIPGKAAVGIEVPNKENTMVSLRELLDTKDFKDFPSRLTFAVGRDIGGKVVVSDIAKMPHMLIAGSTGSGKSVCINTLIMSILYKAKPDEVKLILVDPKVVELSVYNGIPHLLIPVVTDPKQASAALHWGVAEMEDRYKKFADWNVRDLKGYNKKVQELHDKGTPDAPAVLPQIVIIVDELADLMMVAPGEVEESICRLAQLARAAGIHLIIATQRPSVDVITGLIKANMPSRVAFAVSSGVDSRTILDMNGAEKLLGKGDMLFYPQGYSKPARVQGAFVSDGEVSDVVDYLKNQVIGNVYDDGIVEKVKTMEAGGGSGASGGDGGSDRDEYFEKAARFIIDKDKASIGMLQRVLKVGFNRAARIMDQLADAGIVGEEEGTKPRKVLMSMEEFEEYVEEVL